MVSEMIALRTEKSMIEAFFVYEFFHILVILLLRKRRINSIDFEIKISHKQMEFTRAEVECVNHRFPNRPITKLAIFDIR